MMNIHNDEYTSYEITEEQYNNTEYSLLDTEVETSYKKLTISTKNNNVTLVLQWKKAPKYQSYDVISLSGDGVKFINSSLDGTQRAVKNNTTELVRYDSSSSNAQTFNNGLGVSMNLIDEASSYYLQISVQYITTGTNPIIYGNYRHARSNVSLSQSKKYNLNNNKINFTTTDLNNIYDSVDTVYIDG